MIHCYPAAATDTEVLMLEFYRDHNQWSKFDKLFLELQERSVSNDEDQWLPAIADLD